MSDFVVKPKDLSSLLDAGTGSLEDRVAILQLISLYSHLVDDFSPVLWGDLFTDDARFEIRFARGGPESASVMDGRQSILDLILPRQARFREQGIQRRHYLTNPAVADQLADSARVMAYLMLVSSSPDRGMEVVGTGRYDGLVVKTPAGWRIQQWCMTADGDGQSLTSEAESR